LQLLIAMAVYGSGLLWAVRTNNALRVEESSLQGVSAQAEALPMSPREEIYQQDV
jgi:hypothetical protein